jgi:hypothetical protein
LDVSVPDEHKFRKRRWRWNAVREGWVDPKREVLEIVKNSCVPIIVGHALTLFIKTEKNGISFKIEFFVI